MSGLFRPADKAHSNQQARSDETPYLKGPQSDLLRAVGLQPQLARFELMHWVSREPGIDELAVGLHAVLPSGEVLRVERIELLPAESDHSALTLPRWSAGCVGDLAQCTEVGAQQDAGDADGQPASASKAVQHRIRVARPSCLGPPRPGNRGFFRAVDPSDSAGRGWPGRTRRPLAAATSQQHHHDHPERSHAAQKTARPAPRQDRLPPRGGNRSGAPQ